tara:strand:- start:372 stop:989 length:618 start_codon:yes stop_codon:yes gene_type:complete
MGGACSAISEAFSGGGDTTRDQGAPRGSTMTAPANSATDNLLMDLGIKDKNDVYDRDLKARQMESTAALEEFTSQQKSNDKDSPPAATVTATDTTTTTDTGTDTTTTTLDTETDTDLTEVETISETTFGDGDFVGDAGSGASVGTASGGDEQAAAASATSVGAAEDEAIDLMKKGRRSTILTTPGGLLGTDEEEGKTRRRRSLIG